MSFELPSNDPLTDQQGMPFRTWAQWLSRVHNIAVSLQQSGPTADRPTKLLWIGRRYFDTDLGAPVWVQSVRPTVWVSSGGGSGDVDTTNDVIVDNSARGLVLKSPDGHYWRLTVDNAGALTTTDLGTVKP